MAKVLKYLFCALVLIGAVGKEVVQKYYSSPVPDPSTGRMVETWGTDDRTLYVTPQTEHFFWVLFGLGGATFVAMVFWPAEAPATQVRPLTPGSGTPVTRKLVYDWQPQKRSRYGKYAFIAVAFGIALHIWITERNMTGWWWPRITILAVALWSLRMLIDYRTVIDTETGTFEREKLLFGRYHVGALRLPLSPVHGCCSESL